jgi:hypothetical protein
LINSLDAIPVLQRQPRAVLTDWEDFQYKNKLKRIMNKTQKTLLVSAAIAGLVGGAVAKAKLTDNNQTANVAGKQASSASVDRAACNSCGGKGGCGGSGKTNKVY